VTKGTRKISVRLDADLHDTLQKLVEAHPRQSKSAVIEQMIAAGLTKSPIAEARIYLEGAVANLAVILELLRRDREPKAEAIKLVQHFYGVLLEMVIDIEGVEA